jgi:hypothetical protein
MVALLKILGFCSGAVHISALSAGGSPRAAAAQAESAFHIIGALTSELPLDMFGMMSMLDGGDCTIGPIAHRHGQS